MEPTKGKSIVKTFSYLFSGLMSGSKESVGSMPYSTPMGVSMGNPIFFPKRRKNKAFIRDITRQGRKKGYNKFKRHD